MSDWKAQFTQQRRDFLLRTAERLNSVFELLQKAAQQPQDAGTLRELNGHFHQLAGSSAIYELDRLGELASELEKLLLEVLKRDTGITKTQWKKIKESAESMQYMITQHPDAEAGMLPGSASAGGSANMVEQPSASGTGWAASSLTSHGKNRFEKPKEILIVDGDQMNLLNLTRSFEQAGMVVRGYRTGESAKTSMTQRLPDALLLSIPLIDCTGYEIAQGLRSLPDGNDPPVIIISRQIGFLDKVMAIRSGADAIFDESADPEMMVRKLRSLFERDQPENYSILSVEDDPAQSMLIRQVLEQVGYTVHSISDPRLFEEALGAANPDLILMDVMLGALSGFELARFVRSDDRYAATPLIFLTTQNQLNAHVEGARVGGDEYLIKPVAPPLLISAVAGRLERYRVVKKLIGRDVLTQFLTLGSFMESAARAVDRRYRSMGSTAMLLLDIDHMEEINERYGYSTGDRVIACFARLLKQTIRNAEIIARTDGDEFAVIVEGVDDRELADVATQCIRDFEKIMHSTAGKTFNATASVGAAALHTEMDLKTWFANARIALKSAKSTGRNRVMKARSRTTRLY